MVKMVTPQKKIPAGIPTARPMTNGSTVVDLLVAKFNSIKTFVSSSKLN